MWNLSQKNWKECTLVGPKICTQNGTCTLTKAAHIKASASMRTNIEWLIFSSFFFVNCGNAYWRRNKICNYVFKSVKDGTTSLVLNWSLVKEHQYIVKKKISFEVKSYLKNLENWRICIFPKNKLLWFFTKASFLRTYFVFC